MNTPSEDAPTPPEPGPPEHPRPEHRRPEGARSDLRRRTLVGGAVMVALAAVATFVGLLVSALPAVGAWDLAVVDAANRGLAGPVSGLALGIDLAFGLPLAPALAVLAALVSGLLRRSAWAGLVTAALIAVPWAVIEAVKLVVGRPRPEFDPLVHQLLAQPDSSSFPSGHTAFAVALCAAIVLALPGGWWRRAGSVVAVLVVVTTAWSRVALGMHHPTDVLVSMLLVPVLALVLARLLEPFARRAASVRRSVVASVRD